jgi:hypothetical protein
VSVDLLSAKDVAKDFLLAEISADRVGDFLESKVEAENTATHFFTTLDEGYRGWMWAVTISGNENISLSEIVLIPGSDALLAPKWIPWEQRLQDGDLGVGDVLPTAPDDARLVAGFSQVEGLFDETATPFGWEVGVGRKRVLSEIGREQAINRWYGSTHGPNTPMAELANDKCFSCGFYVPLSGALGRMFGVCANSYAQDDGKVVSLDHGCGGHSEVVSETKSVATGTTVVDESGFLLPDEVVDDLVEEQDLEDADLSEVDEFAHDEHDIEDDEEEIEDELDDEEAHRLEILDEVLNKEVD